MPGMLLNTLQCTGLPHNEELCSPKGQYCHVPHLAKIGFPLIAHRPIIAEISLSHRSQERRNTLTLGTTKGPNIVLSTDYLDQPLRKILHYTHFTGQETEVKTFKSIARERQSQNHTQPFLTPKPAIQLKSGYG